MEFAWLALCVAFVLALGGRDQLIVAQFTDQLERTPPLLATGIVAAISSAAIMVGAAAHLSSMLNHEMVFWLTYAAWGVVGIRLFPRIELSPMAEPTRSFVAIGAVVFARQLLDAPRLAIFALALLAPDAGMTVVGGIIGGALAIALGWSLGLGRLGKLPLLLLRRFAGVCIIVAAGLIALNTICEAF